MANEPSPKHQTEKQPPESRDNYRYWLKIPTRWQDGDPYGHVNNVVYYSFFDTVLTKMLIEQQVLRSPFWNGIGLCIESQCQFHRPLTFPEVIDAGLRIVKISTSSLRYEISLFAEGSDEPAASGYFVHVFVDPDTRRPLPLVDEVKARMQALLSTASAD